MSFPSSPQKTYHLPFLSHLPPFFVLCFSHLDLMVLRRGGFPQISHDSWRSSIHQQLPPPPLLVSEVPGCANGLSEMRFKWWAYLTSRTGQVATSSFYPERFDYFQLETECLLRKNFSPLLPCRRRFRKGTLTAGSLSEPLMFHKTRVGDECRS